MNARLARTLFWLLVALLAVRVATLGSYVLYDTTEARYGEVARLMLATGDWITPQNEPGVPFWAKPPMYAWAGAASMAVFGVDEFGVRLPSVLFCALALWIVAAWMRAIARQRGADADQARSEGLAAALILGTMALYFVSAGAIMTEASLVLSTTWMLAAFWCAVARGDTSFVWRWGFFIAIGIGMLAKGPVALVYPGMGIFVWVLVRNAWVPMWQRLPWVRGLLLALLICAPWYVAAEIRTPGYWYYFFVGEHVMRFTQPGWKGDLYGTAHMEPIGKIWLYWIGAALPWTLLVIAAPVRWLVRRVGGRADLLDATHLYLILGALMPVLFFTVARNIIWTYVLPALPPLAMLLAPMCVRFAARTPLRANASAAGMVVLFAAYVAIFVAVLPHYADGRSSASIVRDWQQATQTAPGPLYFLGKTVPHSAKFYTRATARALSEDQLAAVLAGPPIYLVVSKHDKSASEAVVPESIAVHLDQIGSRDSYVLYRTKPGS